MEWVVGIVGLLVGFGFGQWILLRLLKDRSKYDLLNDKSLRWKYGLLGWAIAGATCAVFLWLYGHWTE
jgi:hypothetical protein